MSFIHFVWENIIQRTSPPVSFIIINEMLWKLAFSEKCIVTFSLLLNYHSAFCYDLRLLPEYPSPNCISHLYKLLFSHFFLEADVIRFSFFLFFSFLFYNFQEMSLVLFMCIVFVTLYVVFLLFYCHYYYCSCCC